MTNFAKCYNCNIVIVFGVLLITIWYKIRYFNKILIYKFMIQYQNKQTVKKFHQLWKQKLIYKLKSRTENQLESVFLKFSNLPTCFHGNSLMWSIYSLSNRREIWLEIHCTAQFYFQNLQTFVKTRKMVKLQTEFIHV